MNGIEEREVKLSVPAGFTLPALGDLLAQVTVRDHGDAVLDAVYWDTDDLALAGAGVGVRHRNGVWTFKGPSRREGDALVREELEVEGDGATLPDRIGDRLAELMSSSRLHPVARLRTVRRRLDVTAGDEEAEVVHDRVSVRDGVREVTHFEEVEVEHTVASDALAGLLVDALVRAGAAVDTTPKYVRALRALGRQPPAIDA